MLRRVVSVPVPWAAPKPHVLLSQHPGVASIRSELIRGTSQVFIAWPRKCKLCHWPAWRGRLPLSCTSRCTTHRHHRAGPRCRSASEGEHCSMLQEEVCQGVQWFESLPQLLRLSAERLSGP